MPDRTKPILECVDILKAKKAQLLELRDLIFLIGFGNPFTSENRIVLNAEFKKYKNEVAALNDAMLDMLNERRKVNPNTVSLSFEWLRQGQNFSRQLWLSAYHKLTENGINKRQAIFTLTELLKEIEIDHLGATLTTKNETGKSIGLDKVALPLITASNKISPTIGLKIEEAEKNIRTQFIGLCKNTSPESIFEKSTRIIRAQIKANA